MLYPQNRFFNTPTLSQVPLLGAPTSKGAPIRRTDFQRCPHCNSSFWFFSTTTSVARAKTQSPTKPPSCLISCSQPLPFAHMHRSRRSVQACTRSSSSIDTCLARSRKSASLSLAASQMNSITQCSPPHFQRCLPLPSTATARLDLPIQLSP